jgi:hypothetical protein
MQEHNHNAAVSYHEACLSGPLGRTFALTANTYLLVISSLGLLLAAIPRSTDFVALVPDR